MVRVLKRRSQKVIYLFLKKHLGNVLEKGKIRLSMYTRQASQRQEMDQLQNSFVKIELFEGDSSEDGRQWLERFQYLARFKNLTDGKRLETLPLLFRNKAYDWFECLRGGHKR